MTRAWLYSRTSGDEADTGQDVKEQEALVRSEAITRGFVVAGSSLDDGVSGDTDPERRDGFAQAVAAVRAGLADLIAIREASRFSRQHPAVALLGFRQFQANGINVVSLTEPEVDGRRPATLTDDLVLFIRFMMGAAYLEAVKKGTGLAMREIKAGRRKTKSGQPVGAPRKVGQAEAESAQTWMEKDGLSLRKAAHRLSEQRGAFTTTDAKVRRDRTVSHQALADALNHFGLSGNPDRSGSVGDQGADVPGRNGSVADQANKPGDQATTGEGNPAGQSQGDRKVPRGQPGVARGAGATGARPEGDLDNRAIGEDGEGKGYSHRRL